MISSRVETDNASLNFHIQRKAVVDTIYIENLLNFFSDFQNKLNPGEIKKKRVIDDDEDDEKEDRGGQLITDIAIRCSKQSRVESLKSSTTTKEVLDISLDAIKRQFGVDPNLMRDYQSALDNEANFSNPTYAYAKIHENPPIVEDSHSVQSCPNSVPPSNKHHVVKDLPVSAAAASSFAISDPSEHNLPKPLTFKEKNQMMYEKWKKCKECSKKTFEAFCSIPLKQNPVNISVSYRNFEDGGVITRPYQTLVSW